VPATSTGEGRPAVAAPREGDGEGRRLGLGREHGRLAFTPSSSPRGGWFGCVSDGWRGRGEAAITILTISA